MSPVRYPGSRGVSRSGPAVLDMSTLAAFEQLLGGLSSVDNAARAQYEALFNECKKQPDVLCLQLVRALRTSAQVETREMASILLRRVLTKDEVSLWANLQAQTQEGIKGELLKSLQEESAKSIVRKVRDVVCELAAGIFEDGKWPELSPSSSSASPTGSRRSSRRPQRLRPARRVHRRLARAAPRHAARHPRAVPAGCGAEVKLASLRACCAFVDSLENQHDRAKFQDLLPAMLQTLGGALQGATRPLLRKRSPLRGARGIRPSIRAQAPRARRRRHDDHGGAQRPGERHASPRDGVPRHAHRGARSRARHDAQAAQFVPRLFNCLVAFLLDVEDEQEWHTCGEGGGRRRGRGRAVRRRSGVPRPRRHRAGREHRPAVRRGDHPGVAGKIGDWRKRHAALVAMAQIAEGCVKGMKRTSRGRWPRASGGDLRSPPARPLGGGERHRPAVHRPRPQDPGEGARADPPRAARAMEDSSHRVQSHAAAAMVNFSEGCPPEHMQPYLDALMNKLLQMLQGGHRWCRRPRSPRWRPSRTTRRRRSRSTTRPCFRS